MIVEYRIRPDEFNGIEWGDWEPVHPNTKFEDLTLEDYVIRINKNRQYHRIDTPGFKEAYNEAISWMKLTGKYDNEWSPWK